MAEKGQNLQNPNDSTEDDGKGTQDMENEAPEAEEQEEQLPEADEVSISNQLATGFRVVVIAILLTSVLYTLALTGIGNLAWKGPARGSLVESDGRVVGSKLIGQSFSSEGYFHPRPSSKNYDAMDSGSANLAPTNEKLVKRARSILKELEEEGVRPEEVPVSFVTESGSALDPDISLRSAELQVPRISRATGISQEELREIIDRYAKWKLLGLFGLNRVNVLELNLKIHSLLESD